MDTIRTSRVTQKKGSNTRESILREAVSFGREIGLSALSIGVLAERVGMSKSGLFAHFGSKEDLQLAVLKAAQDEFTTEVVQPALKVKRGLTRMQDVIRRWLSWSMGESMSGGCIVLAACHEFDDRPGPVRDYLQMCETSLLGMIRRMASQAVEEGELQSTTDLEQLSFEVMGIVMSAQLHHRLLQDPNTVHRAVTALSRLIDSLKAPSGATPLPA